MTNSKSAIQAHPVSSDFDSAVSAWRQPAQQQQQQQQQQHHGSAQALREQQQREQQLQM